MFSIPDDHELQSIVETAFGPLLLYARQWNEEDAEDAVQTALLTFFKKFGGGQKAVPENPVGWLFRVVRNEMNLRLRKEKTRRKHEQQYSEVCEPWFISTAETNHDAAILTENLRKLPLENREVIVAKIWGELSFEEIAKLLGTSRSTAHRRYVEGLEQLKNSIR